MAASAAIAASRAALAAEAEAALGSGGAAAAAGCAALLAGSVETGGAGGDLSGDFSGDAIIASVGSGTEADERNSFSLALDMVRPSVVVGARHLAPAAPGTHYPV